MTFVSIQAMVRLRKVDDSLDQAISAGYMLLANICELDPPKTVDQYITEIADELKKGDVSLDAAKKSCNLALFHCLLPKVFPVTLASWMVAFNLSLNFCLNVNPFSQVSLAAQGFWQVTRLPLKEMEKLACAELVHKATNSGAPAVVDLSRWEIDVYSLPTDDPRYETASQYESLMKKLRGERTAACWAKKRKPNQPEI